jgi:hypothetical protein
VAALLVVGLASLAMGGRADAAGTSGPVLQQQPTSYTDWGIGAAMGYDPDTQQLLLYGGTAFTTVCGCNGTGGTWVWNGSDFSLVVPDGASTFYSRLVFDAATHQMLRTGGTMADDSTPAGTTSVWTGSSWQTLSPAHQPTPAQDDDLSAYDARTGQLILVGIGSGGVYGPATTWTWTGADWQQLHPSQSPPARVVGQLAYDDATGQLVLYGGSGSLGLVGDTWVWDGRTWKQRLPTTTPGPLANPAMSYDPALHALVLFGGQSQPGFASGSAATWTWTGSSWRPVTSAVGPTDVLWPTMAFDAATAQMVVMAPYRSKPDGVAHTLLLLAAPTSTSLVASGDGQPVTLTATVAAHDVTAPGGTVRFTADGTTMKACSTVPVTRGQATCTFTTTPGSHAFRAVYSPVAGFLGSRSATVDLTVA